MRVNLGMGEATHTHTHTHRLHDLPLVSPSNSSPTIDDEHVARLRALGLRPSQARFAELYAALDFPEHKALADAAGMSVDAASSRMHRLRRRFGLNQLQLVALLTRVLGSAGDPGTTFFHPERGVRGTNKEGER